MDLEFGTLDFNNLVLLVIAILGIVNTVLTMRANKTAKQTRDIAKQTETNTKDIVAKVQHEHDRMAELLNGTLGAVKKGRHK